MITQESLLAILFLLGIIFGYALCKYELRPVQYRAPRPPKMTKEEEDTVEFLKIMNDETRDDLRLKQYKPRRVRNASPLAIAAVPHATSANMRSIQGWMEDNNMYNETRRMSRMT